MDAKHQAMLLHQVQVHLEHLSGSKSIKINVHLEQVDVAAAIEEQGGQNHRTGIKTNQDEKFANCCRKLFHCLGSHRNFCIGLNCIVKFKLKNMVQNFLMSA